jgi:hypothetical protein
MERGALLVVVLSAVATTALAHTSRLPGRFEKHGIAEPKDGCELAFTLGGVGYNVSSLQVPSPHAPLCWPET